MSSASENSDGAGREIILRCSGIRKSFPGLVALDNVDFEVSEGEIRAVVGENGAGKSTLVKVITGVYHADAGEITLNGRKLHFHGPLDALAQRIAIIHQDPNVVGPLKVWQNVFLSYEARGPMRLLAVASMRKKCQELLDSIEADFGPDDLAQNLTIAQREQVAICAALVREPKILILDEPTASLSSKEIAKLFGIVRSLKNRGVTIIYISHHLGEIFELADNVTVLRDGKVVGTASVKEVDRAHIIRMMIGRDLRQLYPKQPIDMTGTLLETRHLSCHGKFRDVTLQVRSGEVVGICGLLGSGRSELARALFGAERDVEGELFMAGTKVDLGSPHGPHSAGIAHVPEDRRTEGFVGELSVRENLAISNLLLWSQLGFVNRTKESAAADAQIKSLRIATVGPEQQVQLLSGGNQQKVVLGKWLISQPKVFVLNEPTVGVDVGAKVEIYTQVMEFVRQGGGVVFVSSDLDELMGMCDRILVMVKGRVTKELAREEFSQETILLNATASDGEVEVAARKTADAEANRKPVARPFSFGAFIRRWGTIMGIVLALIAFSIATPRFLVVSNLFDVLKQGSVLALIAIGLTLALISAGFDMSVGALSQFTSNLAAGIVASKMAVWGSVLVLPLLVGGGVGLAVGALNAALVLVFRMPPFVATLGTMFTLMGVTLAFNHGLSTTLMNQETFFFMGQGYLGPIPVIVVIVAVLVLILVVFLRRTRPGLRMYAAGGNINAAVVRGVSRNAMVLLSFLLCGLVVGLSGTILASYSYGASAVPASMDFLISALAASFLGTTFNRAGQLDLIGTTVAAMFIAAINNGLILIHVSNLALPGFQGIILILSILPVVIRKNEIGQVTIF
jgi:ribose transport system ATP-binding protein